jgi:hypothetical protein
MPLRLCPRPTLRASGAPEQDVLISDGKTEVLAGEDPSWVCMKEHGSFSLGWDHGSAGMLSWVVRTGALSPPHCSPIGPFGPDAPAHSHPP